MNNSFLGKNKGFRQRLVRCWAREGASFLFLSQETHFRGALGSRRRGSAPAGPADPASSEASLVWGHSSPALASGILSPFQISLLPRVVMCLHVSSYVQLSLSTLSVSRISKMILWENDLPEGSLQGAFGSLPTSLPSLVWPKGRRCTACCWATE